MRAPAVVLSLAFSMLAACAPSPTYVTCDTPQTACSDGCVDLAVDPDNCGSCGNRCAAGDVCEAAACIVVSQLDACATNNGGCSQQAFCMDVGGTAQCLCMPGFTGDGATCAECAVCDSTQFAAAPCDPVNDTVCTACTECLEGSFESTPCEPFADRTCSVCTQCTMATYTAVPCTATEDAKCLPCEQGCLSCDGPGATCFVCDTGYVLDAGACVPAMCGNAVLESGEQCDDGDVEPGDGCSDQCMVEAGSYCFGEVFSICRAGSCVVDPATAALGSAFSLDGMGTPSAAGTLLTQRSMIRTTAAVHYPVLVEATVVYSGSDVTYAGTRGDGLRDGAANDEPTDALRARLSPTTVELATGPGTTTIASIATPFSPSLGVPYRVRFVDDGLIATIEWFNLLNPAEGVGLQELTSYHGSDDRAFVGGGDQGAVTVSDIRVCSAPELPVTAGLAAHYTAIPSWTVTRDTFDAVSSWLDRSGNGRDLAVSGTNPTFGVGAIVGQQPGIDFAGGGRLATAAFPLTTDVSVFAVIHHTTPAQWGAIAHHGSRDNDWSMEQSGGGDPNELHWQTNNDNTNMNLTLSADTSYVMTGIFAGTDRYFSATTFDASTIAPVTITDASHTIAAGTKTLYVGTSDNNETSNAVIGELVYFDRALNASERDAVIAYLRALWRPL